MGKMEILIFLDFWFKIHVDLGGDVCFWLENEDSCQSFVQVFTIFALFCSKVDCFLSKSYRN